MPFSGFGRSTESLRSEFGLEGLKVSLVRWIKKIRQNQVGIIQKNLDPIFAVQTHSGVVGQVTKP